MFTKKLLMVLPPTGCKKCMEYINENIRNDIVFRGTGADISTADQ